MASCTKTLIGRVGKMVRAGIPPIVAAEAHGVGEAEFAEWMRKGQVGGAGHAFYSAFVKEIAKAEAESEVALVQYIAMSPTWQSAAWLLERRWPERYVRKSVGGDKSKPGDPGQADPFRQVDGVVPIRAVK